MQKCYENAGKFLSSCSICLPLEFSLRLLDLNESEGENES